MQDLFDWMLNFNLEDELEETLEGKLKEVRLTEVPLMQFIAEDNAKSILLTRVNNDFIYHPPFGDQVARYAAIREYGRQMAIQIVEDTPISREQDMALTHLENAIFYANAAIARHEREPLSTNDA